MPTHESVDLAIPSTASDAKAREQEPEVEEQNEVSADPAENPVEQQEEAS